MPIWLGESTRTDQAREYFIKYRDADPRGVANVNGLAVGEAIDSALPGRIQKLDYGFAVWTDKGSRKVIPFSQIIEVEEVF